MGMPIRMTEKPMGIYFWHTLEMNMPMDEADTAAMLYSKVCGSTCTFRMTVCDFLSFL